MSDYDRNVAARGFGAARPALREKLGVGGCGGGGVEDQPAHVRRVLGGVRQRDGGAVPDAEQSDPLHVPGQAQLVQVVGGMCGAEHQLLRLQVVGARDGDLAAQLRDAARSVAAAAELAEIAERTEVGGIDAVDGL